MTRPTLAFFGSSLLSAYWNGAATYYRGIIRALHARGWQVTFYEPDAYDRQAHRDLEAPPWARVVVYDPRERAALDRALDEARHADVVVKASGVGVCDEELDAAVAALAGGTRLAIYWDVDAPATLDRLGDDPHDPLRALVPRFDLVLTYGGGPAVVENYLRFGARGCVPIYNAVDPDTHFPAAPDPRFAGELAFAGNRLPDRESRVDEFFFKPASRRTQPFVLAGNGWSDKTAPPNVRYVGHLYTRDHNAFNSSSRVVLNVNRASMARYGFSPATRVFEAVGAGACLMTDAWPGLDQFLEPEREVIVVGSADEVVERLAGLDPARARAIGEAARGRVLAQHTYTSRVAQLEELIGVRGLVRS